MNRREVPGGGDPVGPVDRLLSSAKDPYELARQLGTDRYMSLVRSAANWRRMAFGSLLVSAACIAGLIFLGAQPKTVPYTVAVDRIGNVIAVGTAGDPATVDAKRVIYQQVVEEIEYARAIVADKDFQERIVRRVYDRVAGNSQAKTFLDDYYRSNNPFAQMKEGTRLARVTNVLQESPTTWRVEWVETTSSINGETRRQETWKALVSFEREVPTDEEGIRKNPIGLWIKQLSWEKVQ